MSHIHLIISVPVIGEPPVFLGSSHVRVAESWRILMTCGGGGESGTSEEIIMSKKVRFLHFDIIYSIY